MNNKPSIEITENGPYMVSGNLPLQKEVMVPDDNGNPYEWQKGDSITAEEEPYFLCRCGHSKHKPFCDDTHLAIGFDGNETAQNIKFDEVAATHSGPELILKDAMSFCSSARFCR